MRGLTRKGTNQLPPVPAPCFSLCASLLYFNLRSYRGLTDAGTHGGRMLPASHNTCCAVNIGHDKNVFLHMFYTAHIISIKSISTTKTSIYLLHVMCKIRTNKTKNKKTNVFFKNYYHNKYMPCSTKLKEKKSN